MKEVLELERKWLIPGKISFPEGLTLERIKITQVYLVSDKKERIRISQYKDHVKYTHTIKRTADGGGNWELERNIDAEEYCQLSLRANKDCFIIIKERNVFYYDNLKYELDFFIHPIKTQILEVEVDTFEREVSIPDWIGRSIEVTNIKGFSNKRIASNPEITLKKIESILA